MSRIRWSDLPAPVQAAAQEIIGDEVVTAESQPGGFSPGTADRVVTRSGTRAFVKAVSPDQNVRSAQFARREGEIAAALPASAPVPRLLGRYDDGHWVLLVFEDVEGHEPRTPWVEEELAAAVAALHGLARTATPAPLDDLTAVADDLAGPFQGWANLAATPWPELDPWATANLDELQAAAERGLAAISGGDTLVHNDIRADNIRVRPDGSVVIVDWPWACRGPQWLDSALLGMNVIFYGGDPAPAFAGIDPAVCWDVTAAHAGFYLDVGRDDDPLGLPAVRKFARDQGTSFLPWLRENRP